ncbi:MAG: tetratricopeptide repeat protein [Chitinophagales bacterium]|nr:tetratricopeptide repeat protein [Chitinophagales bacterium]MBP9190290.1 tetratricopeptide repeat protein [Chitinophagales bacterium]MBP9548064.1 tetratricopeptide repeat protein [Chitinophagales bacterium]
MKKITFILSLFFMLAANAQDSLDVNLAKSQYDNNNYSAAIKIYENLIAANGPSPEIYYNLGNAYYKTKQFGLAILNYERCLQITPNDKDATFNLELANLHIKDKLAPVNRLFIIRWWQSWINILQTNQWLIISIILIWLAAAGFAVYRISRKIQLRKTGFFIFGISILLFVFAIICTYAKAAYDSNYHFGIITQPSLIIKSEPSENSTNLVMLHEGLKLRILGLQNNWYKVEMPDGNQGWALAAGVAKI